MMVINNNKYNNINNDNINKKLLFLFGFPILQLPREGLTLNALAQGKHPIVSIMASHSPELDCTFQVPLTSQTGSK